MSQPSKRVVNLKGEEGGVYMSTAAKQYTPASGYTYFDSITATQTMVAALGAANIGGDSMASVTIPAGCTIHGKFTSITPASGAGFAYNAV